MKLSSNFVKHFVLGTIFGGALLLGFGAIKANAQVFQERYYGGYNNGNYNRQDRHHQKHEKRELKHHQRHEREYYGNSRQLRRHQRQEKHQLKHHQRRERRNDGRYDRGGYYPYNYWESKEHVSRTR